MALALHKAAGLKPEIRLAQALSEFETILNNDQKTRFRQYRGNKPPSSNDAMILTAEIDAEHGRRVRRPIAPRVTNVLQSVQQFSNIVDIIVGGSQSLMASAIWAMVKTTMQVTCGYLSYFENLSSLFMRIGLRSPVYQDYGVLYSESTRLQKSLCEYFIVITKLCKQAVSFLNKSTVAQFSLAVLKPFQSEFGPFEIELEQLAIVVREEVALAQTQEQRLDLRENSTFRMMAQTFSSKISQEIESYKFRKAKSQILDSCSTYDYQTAWRQARKLGTSRWIYDNEDFRNWKTASGFSVFWCSGILGSGKTVLSASLVEHLITTVPTATVAYIFIKNDDLQSLECRALVGSLARQLLEPLGFDLFIGTSVMIPMDTEQIVKFLVDLLNKQMEKKEYFILIDGLDACNENEANGLILMLHGLSDLTHNVHVYCSGRPDIEHRTLNRLRPSHSVSLSEPSLHTEIKNYIELELEHRLESGSLCLGDPNLILTIQEELVKGSQGMFLWVAFQLDSICSQATDEDIRKCLASLPKNLPTTFNRILQGLEERFPNSRMNKSIFNLTAAAWRPLDLDELSEALAVIPGDTTWDPQKLINDMRRTLDCCGSLLVVDEERSTIHFAHHSIKQHLLSEIGEPGLDKYRVSTLDADLHLGEICVTYLNYDIFNTQLTRHRASPILFSRAFDALPAAVLNKNNMARSSATTRMAALTILRGKGKGHVKYDVQSQLEQTAGRATKAVSEQHYFLSYAQESWAHHTKRFEVNSQTTYPLFRRIVNGEISIARPPWGGSSHKDIIQSIPSLQWTSASGHEAWVRLLLRRSDVDINSKVNERGHTALSSATTNGHETVMQVLLAEANIIADPKSDNGWTPLALAAERGHESMVKALLRHGGVDVNSRFDGGKTALAVAARQGHVGTVKLLLSQDGVDVNPKDDLGQTPLFWSVVDQQEATVRALLAHPEIDVNCADGDGMTPLAFAVSIVDIVYVELLLAHENINADPRDKITGRTPLSYAAGYGNEDAVRLLIDSGNVHIEAQDDNNRTALWWAHEHGHDMVLRLLQDKLNRGRLRVPPAIK